MTNEMLGEYTRVVKTGPPVLACGSVFGNAPRERVFFGNFAAPDMPEDMPSEPLLMDDFLKSVPGAHPRPHCLCFGEPSRSQATRRTPPSRASASAPSAS